MHLSDMSLLLGSSCLSSWVQLLEHLRQKKILNERDGSNDSRMGYQATQMETSYTLALQKIILQPFSEKGTELNHVWDVINVFWDTPSCNPA